MENIQSLNCRKMQTRPFSETSIFYGLSYFHLIQILFKQTLRIFFVNISSNGVIYSNGNKSKWQVFTLFTQNTSQATSFTLTIWLVTVDKDFRNLKTWKCDFFLYWQNDFLLAAEGNRIHNGYFWAGFNDKLLFSKANR